jgi:DNA-binding NtrC family response regulator
MRKILIVDDDPSLARTLALYFQSRQYDTSSSETGRGGLELWRSEDPDLVLLDVQLPDMDGPEVLDSAKKEGLKGEVIMITAFNDTQATLKAIRLGALDYLYKPIDLNALDLLLEKTIVRKKERERLTKLSHVITDSYKPDQIIGRSKETLDVIKAIAQVSQTAVSVLIEGETGTGKELVARTIHQQSAPGEPFMAVNCAAVVGNLLESELFGHEKGAFTGAEHRKTGILEHAGRGTVLLDEIGEFPLDLQPKLLRVLQEREFQRIGDVRTIPLQARVIAATNRDLEVMVREGSFREDLYFRLKVFVIRMPALRERVEDIVPLAEYFLNRLNQEMHKRVVRIPQPYIEALKNYAWPGNIRELQNVLRRALILSQGEILELDANWLQNRNSGLPGRTGNILSGNNVNTTSGTNVVQSLAEVEKAHILKVLELTNWNYGEACKILEISRPTLRRKIAGYGLTVDLDT